MCFRMLCWKVIQPLQYTAGTVWSVLYSYFYMVFVARKALAHKHQVFHISLHQLSHMTSKTFFVFFLLHFEMPVIQCSVVAQQPDDFKTPGLREGACVSRVVAYFGTWHCTGPSSRWRKLNLVPCSSILSEVDTRLKTSASCICDSSRRVFVTRS